MVYRTSTKLYIMGLLGISCEFSLSQAIFRTMSIFMISAFFFKKNLKLQFMTYYDPQNLLLSTYKYDIPYFTLLTVRETHKRQKKVIHAGKWKQCSYQLGFYTHYRSDIPIPHENVTTFSNVLLPPVTSE